MKLLDRYRQNINKENPPSMVYADTEHIRICIHKIAGCGAGWYLSVFELRITNTSLKTENFNEALENAKQIIRDRFSDLRRDVEEFTL